MLTPQVKFCHIYPHKWNHSTVNVYVAWHAGQTIRATAQYVYGAIIHEKCVLYNIIHEPDLVK